MKYVIDCKTDEPVANFVQSLPDSGEAPPDAERGQMTQGESMSVKEDFEARNEQYARDGHDEVRALFALCVENLEQYEKLGLPYSTSAATLEQTAQVYEDLLSDLGNKEWDARQRAPREALLFAGNPSPRMVQLRTGEIDPTPDDVAELLQDFMEAASYAGYFAGSFTLVEFGKWLAGVGEWEEYGPAEVVW